jgi:hypothetical protein
MKGEYAVSNNLLIVESHNDKFFIERLRKEIAPADFEFEIETPICRIDEYECLGGLSNLEYKLDDIKNEIEKRNLKKVGILLDADNEGIQKRIIEINAAVKTIASDLDILSTNTWYKSKTLDIEISCHILNVNGLGELETLLKAIKSHDSISADCLYSWQECLEKNGKEIAPKDFDKFWISIYGRYDCCSKKEKKQADKKCGLEASLQKDIWDFSHDALTDLKDYLTTFV